MIKRDEIEDTNSCLNKAHDGERLFVLLARDPAAPIAIRAWVAERLRLGKNTREDAQIAEALDCADRMDRERVLPNMCGQLPFQSELAPQSLDRITTARYMNERDVAPMMVHSTWNQLAASLRDHRRGPCTMSTCQGTRCDHKRGPAWSPVQMMPGRERRKENVEAITAAVFNLNSATADQITEAERRLAFDGIRGLVHSTHAHRPTSPRLHLVMPLSRPVMPHEWTRVWHTVTSVYAIPADPAAIDLARMYYEPSAPIDAPVIARALSGTKPLDVDALLAAAMPTTTHAAGLEASL